MKKKNIISWIFVSIIFIFSLPIIFTLSVFIWLTIHWIKCEIIPSEHCLTRSSGNNDKDYIFILPSFVLLLIADIILFRKIYLDTLWK